MIAQQISLFSSDLLAKRIYTATGVCTATISPFCNFLNPILQVWNGCSAACDLVIAASMTYTVCFPFICHFCFLIFDAPAFPTKNELETNSTASPETHASYRCDGGFDRSDLTLFALKPEFNATFNCYSRCRNHQSRPVRITRKSSNILPNHLCNTWKNVLQLHDGCLK